MHSEKLLRAARWSEYSSTATFHCAWNKQKIIQCIIVSSVYNFWITGRGSRSFLCWGQHPSRSHSLSAFQQHPKTRHKTRETTKTQTLTSSWRLHMNSLRLSCKLTHNDFTCNLTWTKANVTTSTKIWVWSHPHRCFCVLFGNIGRWAIANTNATTMFECRNKNIDYKKQGETAREGDESGQKPEFEGKE